MAPRFLTPSDLAAGRAVMRQSRAKQREFARRFDPEVLEALDGWTWGRKSFDLSDARPDMPPRSVVRFASLEATEYIAIKRDPSKGSQRAVYRHLHDSPYATIATTTAGARAMRAQLVTPRDAAPMSVPYTVGSSMTLGPRTAPAFKGPALFVLGELYGLEGRDEHGYRLYWRAPDGLLLAGCPFTSDMHVIRLGAASRSVAPIWIVRGRSPYRLTDRGIER